MKKLLTLLLFFPVFLFAQVTPQRYKFKLASDNSVMELNSSNFIRVAEDCRDRSPNCGNQVWQITQSRISPNLYQIISIPLGKYLTWEEGAEGATRLEMSLKPRITVRENYKYQAFKIIANDKGSYQIQPALDDGVPNNFYLSATLNTGANYAVGLFKRGANGYVNVKDAWRFMPPITPLAPQASPSVVVAPLSDNKLEVDIKTGADNLEPRGFQTNPQITIHVKNRNPIVLENINNNQNWPNNSIKRVSIPLPHDINLEDLLSINIKRTVVSNWNNFDAGMADNWNINRVTATASIKTNGSIVRTIILNKTATSGPLVRIVYEKRNNDNPIEQREITIPFGEGSSSAQPTPAPRTSVANPIIKIETLTGGDDLRGGNDNLNVLIRLKIRPVRNISLNNINAGRKWPNFTERSITKPLMAPPFTFDDIEDIILKHTGGRGTGADDWHLDKLKITLTIGSETRVLIDQVGAPIHYFSGDARSKTFQILR
ncbi:hypothetical protein [Pedobacter sp. Leaf132]|uniref:hypothetical protein n=1 Tax=Pedobacter sp. Leaf132 TaxID=2876557 RepID=UPI001E4538D6|nr:hypothetical protein [Pedobacter sp. Leaf132]